MIIPPVRSRTQITSSENLSLLTCQCHASLRRQRYCKLAMLSLWTTLFFSGSPENSKSSLVLRGQGFQKNIKNKFLLSQKMRFTLLIRRSVSGPSRYPNEYNIFRITLSSSNVAWIIQSAFNFTLAPMISTWPACHFNTL